MRNSFFSFFFSMMNRTLPNRPICRKFWAYFCQFANPYRKILVNAIKKNVNFRIFPFVINPSYMFQPKAKVFSVCINHIFPIIMEGPQKFLTQLNLNQLVFLHSGAENCKIHRVLRLTTPEKEKNTEKKNAAFFSPNILAKIKKQDSHRCFFLLSQQYDNTKQDNNY